MKENDLSNNKQLIEELDERLEMTSLFMCSAEGENIIPDDILIIW